MANSPTQFLILVAVKDLHHTFRNSFNDTFSSACVMWRQIR